MLHVFTDQMKQKPANRSNKLNEKISYLIMSENSIESELWGLRQWKAKLI